MSMWFGKAAAEKNSLKGSGLLHEDSGKHKNTEVQFLCDPRF